MATNEKMRTGATRAETKNWWESSGFFIGTLTVFGSLYGLSEADASSAVMAVTGLLGTGAVLWSRLKTSKFVGWIAWLQDGNTWVYLSSMVGLFLPNADILFPLLKDVSDAVISKNLGAIITAVFALAVFIYNVFIKPKNIKAA